MNEGPFNCESRVRLEVDLGKIVGNFQTIRRRVQPCRLMPVVKANAYGLGMAKIAAALAAAGADAFGVAEINEALTVKPFGIPVQILGNLLPDEVEPAVEAGIWCPVGSVEDARRVSRAAAKQRKTAAVQIAVDTGMGRLGLPAAEAFDRIREIAALDHLELRGIYSHFSSAFDRFSDYSLRQLDKFRQLLAALDRAGIRFVDIHMAASDALNNFPESCGAPFTLARTGINLYGYYDSTVEQSMRLAPAVGLKTRLAAVRKLAAGSFIGYGRTHKLLKDSLVGTVAAGYADGMPLALSNRGYLLIGGTLCPILGRISMDYTTVLLDHAPEAQAGDEVVCIGRQQDQEITVEDWAQLKGTHVYDILCGIGSRVERSYFS
jgi:alanine racemase